MKRNREVFFYLLFGALTTLVNIVSFWILSNMGLNTAFSTIISWILSVLFAFFTNKIYVFESRNQRFLGEMVSFFGCRIFTGLLDLAVMLVFVDFLKFNALVIKILSNIVVIILNFLFSKFLIFKSKKSD